ncbi:MAG TPA: lipid-A-disaccharide synthase [Candidatus Eisenbacteria bacterium]|nr:lipid-A-disaccharide synthase [Candidatus Eisenbacteria bacterium]
MRAAAAGARRRIMVVVGEASGDLLGAELVRALLRRDPNLELFGVAGEQMERLEFEPLFSVARLTGMGLVELAGNAANIWRAFRLLKRVLRERKPDLVVLIDFPEFNLRLARSAKRLRIPVLYYVSPQVWAWRRGRVRQIAERVDRLAVIFPFEAGFYEGFGIKAVFVGHPLLDVVKADADRETALRRVGLDASRPTIALLPGSRRKELAYHLPRLLRAAEILSSERRVQFVCVKAPTVERAELERLLGRGRLRVPIAGEGRYDIIHAADVVWTASGTATLESALLLKPMVVVYRLAWPSYWLARLLVRVEHIAMVNIIAGEAIVPELIQSDFQPEAVVRETRALLDEPSVRQRMIAKLGAVKEKLGAGGAAARVADLAVSMIA